MRSTSTSSNWVYILLLTDSLGMRTVSCTSPIQERTRLALEPPLLDNVIYRTTFETQIRLSAVI